MKALFITTRTNDCLNHVRAWESAYGPAEHVTYDHLGLRNDWQFPIAAERIKPKVIFWIGACRASGNPRPESLIAMRKIAPTVNLCSDAADGPWHGELRAYRGHKCFALQVAIDGARDAPVDHSTLTPVDPRPFAEPSGLRDIRCGFSGTVGRWNQRSEVINSLEWFGKLVVRDRTRGEDSYAEHVAFLKRCRMLLNLSHTGSGLKHHVKGRVLEAGWAGCALLESEGSPIGDWFPPDCYLTFKSPLDAARLIAETTDTDISRLSANLAREVRARYSVTQIYTAIMEKAGVYRPKPLAA